MPRHAMQVSVAERGRLAIILGSWSFSSIKKTNRDAEGRDGTLTNLCSRKARSDEGKKGSYHRAAGSS